MRLSTREAISKEFHIPQAGVDERMAELGVAPYLPSKKGRGWSVLYDANEIIAALQNERERKLAKKQKREARIVMHPTPDIFKMGWKNAKRILTPQEQVQ